VNLGRAAFSYFWGHLYDDVSRSIEACRVVATEHDVPAGVAFAALMDSYVDSVKRSPVELGERASAVLKLAEGSPEVYALGRYLQGQDAEWSGDFPEAERRQKEAIEIARKHKLPQSLLPALWFHAKAACCLGRYREALDSLTEALELTERIGERAQRSRLLNTLGWLHSEVGAHERAAELNQLSAELGRELIDMGLVAGASEIFGNASLNLAGNRIARGELSAAAEAMGPVQEELSVPGDPWMRWRYGLHLLDAEARLALASGEAEQSLGLTERELEGARTHRSRKIEARALELHGRALVALDQRERADRTVRAALELATEIAYPPVQWRCHSLLSVLARRAGHRATAEQCAAEARSLVVGLSPQLSDASVRREFELLGERLVSDPLGAYR